MLVRDTSNAARLEFIRRRLMSTDSKPKNQDASAFVDRRVGKMTTIVQQPLSKYTVPPCGCKKPDPPTPTPTPTYPITCLDTQTERFLTPTPSGPFILKPTTVGQGAATLTFYNSDSKPIQTQTVATISQIRITPPGGTVRVGYIFRCTTIDEYRIDCLNTSMERFLTPPPSRPFIINPSAVGEGTATLTFYNSNSTPIQTQSVITTGKTQITPPSGTKSVGYIFRCTPMEVFTISCADNVGIQVLPTNPNGTFRFETTSQGAGILNFQYFDNPTAAAPPLRTDTIILGTDSQVLTPPAGTLSVGYTFFCNPLLFVGNNPGDTSVLESTYPFTFQNQNNKRPEMTLTLTKAFDSSTISVVLQNGETYTPSPSYGWSFAAWS